ncbi:MAG: phosphatidate cytidylyltransferase [Clostridiales bacterium]|jgi:phosphatidate cytidylyltransferase|nr:phosphatidate cytidylyltransferase [Clostridiales bacterium]
MLARILSSVIGLPILAALIIAGGLYLQLAMAVVAVVGMSEIYSALSGKRLTPAHFVSYAFAVAYFLLLSEYSRSLTIILSLFITALLICVVVFHEKISPADCAAAMFGFFYVAFPLSFICLTRQHELGNYFVWLIFISAWGSDTFAYFTGKTIGRHKLTPKLSPNKTVEGALGGVLGAMLLGFVYGLIATRHAAGVSLTLFCTIITGVGAVLSQFGDLAASAIKRYTNIKDFGQIIPGHGGVLDRFDSVLLTAPGVYLVMYILAIS